MTKKSRKKRNQTRRKAETDMIVCMLYAVAKIYVHTRKLGKLAIVAAFWLSLDMIVSMM